MLKTLALTKVYTQSARLRVFIFSALFLIIPLFGYFSLHVTSRTKYFNERNFRQLRNFSRQISDRIENLGAVFNNAVDRFVKPESGEGISGQSDFQKYLDILKTDGTNLTSTHVDPIPVLKPDTNLQLRSSLDVSSENSTPWLYLDCLGTTESTVSQGEKNKNPAPATIHFIAKTNFDQLIKPLISKTGEEDASKAEREEDFDHVVIARADNGKVIFEQTSGDLTLTSLDNIPLADSPDKFIDLKARSKTTDAVDITVAGLREPAFRISEETL